MIHATIDDFLAMSAAQELPDYPPTCAPHVVWDATTDTIYCPWH